MGATATPGTVIVKFQPAAERSVRRTWPRPEDQEALRRHVLKLRHWPARGPAGKGGKVLDMDWSLIRACAGEKIYELRVADRIGGQRNVRVIFCVAPDAGSDATAVHVLTVMVKKRQRFTSHDLDTFRCGRQNVLADYQRASSTRPRLAVV